MSMYETINEETNVVEETPVEETVYPEAPAAYELPEESYDEGVPVEVVIGLGAAAGLIGLAVAKKDKIADFFGGLKQKRLDKLAKKLEAQGYAVYAPAVVAEAEEEPVDEDEAESE